MVKPYARIGEVPVPACPNLRTALRLYWCRRPLPRPSSLFVLLIRRACSAGGLLSFTLCKQPGTCVHPGLHPLERGRPPSRCPHHATTPPGCAPAPLRHARMAHLLYILSPLKMPVLALPSLSLSTISTTLLLAWPHATCTCAHCTDRHTPTQAKAHALTCTTDRHTHRHTAHTVTHTPTPIHTHERTCMHCTHVGGRQLATRG